MLASLLSLFCVHYKTRTTRKQQHFLSNNQRSTIQALVISDTDIRIFPSASISAFSNIWIPTFGFRRLDCLYYLSISGLQSASRLDSSSVRHSESYVQSVLFEFTYCTRLPWHASRNAQEFLDLRTGQENIHFWFSFLGIESSSVLCFFRPIKSCFRNLPHCKEYQLILSRTFQNRFFTVIIFEAYQVLLFPDIPSTGSFLL